MRPEQISSEQRSNTRRGDTDKVPKQAEYPPPAASAKVVKTMLTTAWCCVIGQDAPPEGRRASRKRTNSYLSFSSDLFSSLSVVTAGRSHTRSFETWSRLQSQNFPNPYFQSPNSGTSTRPGRASKRENGEHSVESQTCFVHRFVSRTTRDSKANRVILV